MFSALGRFTTQRHARVDTTFTNVDYPGHDYKCVGVSALGDHYQEARRRFERGWREQTCFL